MISVGAVPFTDDAQPKWGAKRLDKIHCAKSTSAHGVSTRGHDHYGFATSNPLDCLRLKTARAHVQL